MRMLRINEVSQLLDTHPNVVRRWLDSGALRGGRTPGGRWRVSAAEVKRMQRELLGETEGY